MQLVLPDLQTLCTNRGISFRRSQCDLCPDPASFPLPKKGKLPSSSRAMMVELMGGCEPGTKGPSSFHLPPLQTDARSPGLNPGRINSIYASEAAESKSKQLCVCASF